MPVLEVPGGADGVGHAVGGAGGAGGVGLDVGGVGAAGIDAAHGGEVAGQAGAARDAQVAVGARGGADGGVAVADEQVGGLTGGAAGQGQLDGGRVEHAGVDGDGGGVIGVLVGAAVGHAAVGAQVVEVGRAGVGAFGVVTSCPDESRTGAEGYGKGTEPRAGLAIRSEELGDLLARGQIEEVGSPGKGTILVGVGRGADERHITADGNVDSEQVASLTI